MSNINKVSCYSYTNKHGKKNLIITIGDDIKLDLSPVQYLVIKEALDKL